MNKPQQLRQTISSKGLAHVMAAHSPLSARLAEEAGFDGVWASGFELSALWGLPDISLLSMNQHLETVRGMADQTSLPIVADLDTGFGNALNVLHAVRQYACAGVAAVVLEDKTFPKVTSLLAGGRQELVRTEEFQGKIQAARDASVDTGTIVVARTEALIANKGQDEALARASAYQEAGAEMILVHSKKTTPEEIEIFSKRWHGSAPLVVVPTAYPELDETRIRKLGNVKMVIYGNHAIRSAVTAMQSTFRQIAQEGGIKNVNSKMVTVEEIFRLQGMGKVKSDEEKYLR